MRLRLIVGFVALLLGVLAILGVVDVALRDRRRAAVTEALDHFHLGVQAVVTERTLRAVLASERGGDARALPLALRSLDQAVNQSQRLHRLAGTSDDEVHRKLETSANRAAAALGRYLRRGEVSPAMAGGPEAGLLASSALLSEQELRDVALQHAALRRMERWLLALGVLSVAGVGGLGVWIVPPFVRRVNHLQAVTEQLSAGQFGVRTRLSGPGDLAALGHAINDLSERLLSSRETLAAQRSLLEARNRALDSAVAEVAQSRDAMVKSARAAGMAELAAGVLHNVGNVINGVSVAADTLAGRLRASKVAGVGALAQLLAGQDDIAAFLTGDVKGRQLIPYLGVLGERLTVERDANLEDVRALRDRVEHIVRILQMQQAYAVQGGLLEDVEVGPVIEEALLVALGTSVASGVRVVRDVEAGCVAQLDRHRTLAILVNYLRNAVQALPPEGDGEVTVGATCVGDQITLWVRDNGMGVADDVRDKVFTHGFTTRVGGHGFGLHASANAAREMGAEVGFESDGEGCGATFFLRAKAAATRGEQTQPTAPAPQVS